MALNGTDTGEELVTTSSADERDGNDGASKDNRNKNDHEKRAGGGGLERVTVNLIPRASKALEQTSRRTGDTKTDTINRALQVYAYLEEVWANGGKILAKEGEDVTELKFF
jgi:hypothetical protein